MSKFDLVLKGSHLVDPSQNLDSPKDIGFLMEKLQKLVQTKQKKLSMSVTAL